MEKPKENENIFFISDSENPILRFVVNIAYEEKISEIIFLGYRKSVLQIQYFEELQKLKKLPEKIHLILSDSIPPLVKPTFNYLKDNNNFYVNYINTHAKWVAIKTKDNYYFANSSANSNSDNKIESINIFNNKLVYKKYSQFAEDVKKGFKV